MRRRRKTNKIKKVKKRGRGILYLYENRVYFGKKINRKWCDFKSYCASFRKRRRRYWILMFRKKYVWYVNLEKTNKRKTKTKTKNKKYDIGFSAGFKLLYSLGQQWRNSVQ